eukprot:6505745-Pyramimonas_sp.AAC.1
MTAKTPVQPSSSVSYYDDSTRGYVIHGTFDLVRITTLYGPDRVGFNLLTYNGNVPLLGFRLRPTSQQPAKRSEFSLSVIGVPIVLRTPQGQPRVMRSTTYSSDTDRGSCVSSQLHTVTTVRWRLLSTCVEQQLTQGVSDLRPDELPPDKREWPWWLGATLRPQSRPNGGGSTSLVCAHVIACFDQLQTIGAPMGMTSRHERMRRAFQPTGESLNMWFAVAGCRRQSCLHLNGPTVEGELNVNQKHALHLARSRRTDGPPLRAAISTGR